MNEGDYSAAAREVLRASKMLYDRGMLNANEGNVSARIVGGLFIITPSQVCKADLTEDDLLAVDISTGQVACESPAGRRPSSEMKVHLCCYRQRPDVLAVAHAHPPAATAYAVCGRPIETRAYPEMMLLYGRVPLCRYGRPGTDAVCDDIPEVLKSYDSFLLENHGLVSVGRSAMAAAYALEGINSIAEVLIRAVLLGGESPLPPDECEDIEKTRIENRRRALEEYGYAK